ncbi:MAG: hypothetical protein V2I50_11975 [Desulfuromusa sp.]|jgi:hypothetical protein|nr:hypothetical protein [Desulfuromusa sp.]
MTQNEPIHVVTTQWGQAYNEKDVNNLFSMIRRNTTLPLCCHLFSSENLPGLDPEIQQHPDVHLNMPDEHRKKNYRKTVGLCDDNLAGLTGKRIFVFDLDVLFMDNLDELFRYPKDDRFYIINDWNTRGDHVGQGSCYSLVVGTVGFVKDRFEADAAVWIDRYGSATQQYLSHVLIEKYGTLTFWPEEWFQSFRYHCLPWGPLRHFMTPHKPKPGTKMVAFHGCPGLRDAIQGQWSDPHSNKTAKGWKKLYKSCKPTPWVEEYWR